MHVRVEDLSWIVQIQEPRKLKGYLREAASRFRHYQMDVTWASNTVFVNKATEGNHVGAGRQEIQLS